MHIEAFEITDSRWHAGLKEIGRHDFYHLPEYLALEAAHTRSVARAITASDDDVFLFVPLLFRDITGLGVDGERRAVDATSPYGYGGPLAKLRTQHGAAQRKAMRIAMDEMKAYLKRKGVISVFLRLHPLLPLVLPELNADSECLVSHGETVHIDLGQTEETQWSAIKPKFRYYINRAKRDGVVVVMDEAWHYMDAFIEIYAATMDRLSANEHLKLSRQYFVSMRDRLADVIRLCVVLSDGVVICAGLFSELNGIVQYHLSGALRNAKIDRLCPNRLMIDHVRRWAMARGNGTFHLGGGLEARQDSLFQFKAGFGPARSRFATLRLITNQEKYEGLAQLWQHEAGVPADDPAGFFPAYRKPVPRPTAEHHAEW